MSGDAGAPVVTKAPEGAVPEGPNPKIALCQMCSRNNKEVNFDRCELLVAEAAEKGAQLVCLPECFSFIGAKPGEAQTAAEPLSGPTMQKYKDLAKAKKVWLSLGGFQELPAEGEDTTGANKIYNCHVIVNSEGEIVTSYRKIHLFDAPFTGLVESKQALPGKDLVVCDSPVGKLGVTVCYDIRFPEMYQQLRYKHGVDVILAPSAFTMPTGKAHWELLMRTRAVETQCYVVAAAQAGQHNEDGNKRTSWGHSIAADCWGTSVAEFDGKEVGVRVFEVDRALMEKTRREMPLIDQRRYDLYGDSKK